MKLAGSLSCGAARLPCRLGIERDRIAIVLQQDLARFWFPVSDARLDVNQTALELQAEDQLVIFTPEMPDRFRWIMTAGLQEAAARRRRWWRFRLGPANTELMQRLAMLPSDSAAA